MSQLSFRKATRHAWRPVAALVGVLLLLPACTTEEIIFVERPFFDDPPAGAAGYMGYITSDPLDQNRTVCGECHNTKANAWKTTAHADAWNGLQSSGGAQEFCEGCHTVNQLGNTSTIEGGWLTTDDPRYYDVQCENCHGPGETHVNNPESSNIPLASLAVDLESGCGECHSGAHHPFVEQWEDSPHSEVVASPSTRESCFPCHRGQGTLIAWGENANYVEKFSDEALPVVCGVCHDPHGEAMFEGQLRFPVNTTSSETHLCSKCHNRRPLPEGETSRGPHAPESGLLEGVAGWFPPGLDFQPGEIVATHGSGSNDRWCATCHVVMYEIDDESGAFLFESVGHHFNPIPCLDEQGIPEGFPNECSLSPDERSYVGCVDSGCHASEQVAASALTAKSASIQRLVDELEALLDQLPEGEVSRDPPYTVGDGADFNLQLALHGNEDFGTNTVLGSTVHNPFLMEALLVASLDLVEDEYADILSRVSGRDWEAELKAVLQEAGVR
ncbi:MAG: multiheme c-type cytochrome [Gemmatimonadota bacterium]